MFKIEISPGQNPGLFHNFRIIIFQGGPQWNLGDGGKVLFFTDKEVAFQPVDAVKMLIMFIKGNLVLDIEKD